MQVRLRTLPSQVAAVIGRRVAAGELRDAAPSEAEICAEFGVSRAVAREALKTLEALGTVTIAQGKRVQLRPSNEWDYLNPLLMEWLPPSRVQRILADLHDTRLLVEPELAARAAASIDRARLRRLARLLDEMRRLAEEPDAYLERDLEFHMDIAVAAGNLVLERIMRSSRWLLAASRRVTNLLPSGLNVVTDAHAAIYDALAAHDAGAARAAMRAHLQSVSPVWLEGNAPIADVKSTALGIDRTRHTPEDNEP